MREQLGVWLKDRWRYERALLRGRDHWLEVRNRKERLLPAPSGPGFACDWLFTSSLHAVRIQPDLGRRLMRRALEAAPIRCQAAPDQRQGGASPQLSVLIGHRGEERLPLLLKTLSSFAGQEGVDLECLVIEQDAVPRIASALPAWVRHLHAPLAEAEAPYNRSAAFNAGAKAAKAPVLLLHDNDMLVPAGYAARLLQRIALGYEVINPKRFIFYLSRQQKELVLASDCGFSPLPVSEIVQNLEAGGSLAIRRDCFDDLGGMDEGFVGWGGEDNEFWDRCLTKHCWIWGYEPIIHLWHHAQPLKRQVSNPNEDRYQQRLRIPAHQRIRELRAGRL